MATSFLTHCQPSLGVDSIGQNFHVLLQQNAKIAKHTDAFMITVVITIQLEFLKHNAEAKVQLMCMHVNDAA